VRDGVALNCFAMPRMPAKLCTSGP
jgi:hypothetical protein